MAKRMTAQSLPRPAATTHAYRRENLEMWKRRHHPLWQSANLNLQNAAKFQFSPKSRFGKEDITTCSSMAHDLIDEIEDRALGSRRGGKGSSRGGRGGRGGKGGARGEGREVAISKALSKLLRHAAEDEGLALDSEGFGRLDQVVSLDFLLSVWISLSPAC
jgi:RNA 2'-phosphotransferase, Tpt1 / KptA family